MKPSLRARASALAWLATAAMADGPTPTTSADPRRSGFDAMTAPLHAMQRDDALNPTLRWVGDGQALWNAKASAAQQACAACHGDPRTGMRGVAAHCPAFDAASMRPVDLPQRINLCRSNHQLALPLPTESQELLSLESYVALQWCGQAIAPPTDARRQAATERGAARFRQRLCQLDLACAQCHDDHDDHADHAGQRLGGSTIPQAHPTGYPLYRLEWQGLGSLQRRLRNCMAGVRAEPFGFGAPERVELELYLMQRAAGLPMESPAVRQ